MQFCISLVPHWKIMYCATMIFVEPIKSKATVIKLCLYIPLEQYFFSLLKPQYAYKSPQNSLYVQIPNYLLNRFP